MCKITVSADVFGCSFLSVEISGYSFKLAVLQKQNKSLMSQGLFTSCWCRWPVQGKNTQQHLN